MDRKKYGFIFDINELQKIQKSLAEAIGLASVITSPDGSFITGPNNLCSLCNESIAKDRDGHSHCFKTPPDKIDGSSEPYEIECRIGALWYCVPMFDINESHIANWYIGQIRNGPLNLEKIRSLAHVKAINNLDLKNAIKDIPYYEMKELKQAGKALQHISELMSLLSKEQDFDESYRKKILSMINEYVKHQSFQFSKIRDLTASEQRFKSLVETSHDWIWELDKKANFTYISPRIEYILGYKPDELIGRSGYDLMPPDEGEKISKNFDKFVEQEKPFTNLININIHKEGRKVIMESSGWPFFNSEGELLGYRGADRDITERLESEEMINQSERMKTVGRLAAGMAHEINNPLAAIIQSEQNISRRLSPDFAPNVKIAERFNIDLKSLSKYLESREINSFLSVIRDAGKRAHEIVINLMQISRLEKVDRNYENVKDIIDHALEKVFHELELENHLDFRSIAIAKEYQEDLPPVKCDSLELEQVFQSILINGFEMLERKLCEKPKNYVPALVIRTYERSNFIYIEIEDNGPGIKKELQKRVFEPFYSTKETGKGIGLGLSISYYIITQNHKGNLWVESQIGKGSKFIIELPVQMPSDQ